ncbi:PAS domain-containing protein [Thioploca ingrica]|uniref:PAS domain-containing protein n=1 Tax=Thioploca ingrica TaxID=40754 RepID=A0A090BUA1_9GAMM|nr:PAS domain-containing protein [Thioploca ingrica]
MPGTSLLHWFSRLSGKLPLRVVLLVPFLLQILAIVGLIGYLSLSNGKKSVNELTTALRNEITARIEQHLLSYLKIPHLVNQLNAEALRLGILNLTDPATIERHFWQQLQIFDSVSYISFSSIQGDYIGAERREDYSVQAGQAKHNTFYLYSKDGEYLADEQGRRKKLTNAIKNYDPRERPWYIDTVKAQKPIWSEIYALLDPTNLTTSVTQTVSANQPFYDDNGTFQGVLGTDIFLSQLSEFLSGLQIGKTGETFIMERSGLIVASSTTEKPYRFNPNNPKEVLRLNALDSQMPLIRYPTEYLLTHFSHDLKEINSSNQLEFKLNGQKHFLQVKPLQDKRGIDWLIVVVIPEADFMEHINANTRLTVLLCVIALIIAIMVGSATSRWLIAPIRRLNLAASKIAKGEWEQDLPVERADEIGDLAKSFKIMEEQLQAVFDNLAKINKAYERFVPREFLSFLKKESIIDVQLGDQVQQEMSVLFSDIRAFTSLSERMTPAENFEFINTYLSRMEPAIIENHGFIDKYIGDAIMALFSGGADHAVKAGITMLRNLARYNLIRQTEGQIPIQIGIGINTGSLILGTVGGCNRMDGTVISDAVNLASRIEGLTKMYNALLLISEYTYSGLQEHYAIRRIGRVKVKGRLQPVAIYEVFEGDFLPIKELKMKTLLDFETGLVCYQNREFIEAQNCFNRILHVHPDDKAAQLYLKRCHYFQKYGTDGDWEGVEVMENK